MKHGLVTIIFLLQFLKAFSQTDSINLFTVTISDTCSMCSGAEEMLYVDTTLINAKKVNTIIAKARIYSQDTDYTVPDDFVPKDEIVEGCIGVSTATHVKLNMHGIVSFEYESEFNCGSSVSSPHQFNYLTIDVMKGKKLEIRDIIDSVEMEGFQYLIMTYAKKNKVDNIPYCCNVIHDQTKIDYLIGTGDQFYLTKSSLGIYTKVYDNNPNDWYHRSDSEVVGNEQILVEIPYTSIRKYLKKKSPIAKLVSGM